MYFFPQEFTAMFCLITPNISGIILGTCLKGCLQARIGDKGNSSLTEKKANTVNNFLMTTAVQYLQKVIIT